MDCEQARQLFDAYLDGELGSALATELGAHRVHCAECRQALALLEVSEHLITSDPERRELGADFTNRLLACMDLPDASWRQTTERLTRPTTESEPMVSRLRRGLFWTGVSAAAAMVALAFLGAFDRRGESRVAGLTVLDPSAKSRLTAGVPSVVSESRISQPEVSTEPRRDAEKGSDSGGANEAVLLESAGDEDHRFQEWIGRVRSGIQTKRRSVESLRDAIHRLDDFMPGPAPAGERPAGSFYNPQGADQPSEAGTPPTEEFLGNETDASGEPNGLPSDRGTNEDDETDAELSPSSDEAGDEEPADGLDSLSDDGEGDEPVRPDIP